MFLYINAFFSIKDLITNICIRFLIYIFNTNMKKVDTHRNASVEWYLVGHGFWYLEQSAA